MEALYICIFSFVWGRINIFLKLIKIQSIEFSMKKKSLKCLWVQKQSKKHLDLANAEILRQEFKKS